MQNDPRPKEYLYYNQLIDHLKTQNLDEEVFSNPSTFVWPRQFEIHLPGNHIKSCNMHCGHCAGDLYDKGMDYWESKALSLLNKLEGKIPYHIYGGAYTEPLLNPHFMSFMAITKKYDNHFGIHTNGVLLNQLENTLGYLTELNHLSTDKTDYLSIAIDAGLSWSWAKTKGTKKQELFWEIIEGIKKAVDIRNKNNKGHAIRLCYLISPDSGNIDNFLTIINIAKNLKVDSLRFSIPFASYNQDFEKVEEYKNLVETPSNTLYYDLLKPYLSKSFDEKPYIFYTGPEFTDISKFTFERCFYYLYQVTLGASGDFYKCSTVASPTAKHLQLGEITDNLTEFKTIISKNSNPKFNCKKMCFEKGLRCNRMGLEINSITNKIINEMK